MKVLLLALCAVLVLPVAASAEVLSIEDPVTDNYKASYNEDPSKTELRTWLSLRTIVASGTTWAPTPPDSITVTAGGAIAVTSADGRTGTLTVRFDAGPIASLSMRSDSLDVDSHGKWGPLVTITSRSALQSAPARFTLTLTDSDGATIATGGVSYRYDSAVANVASDSIEYNGPGGRWYVGATATRLNWETSAPTTPVAEQPRSPRITRIIIPTKTSSRFVRMRVLGRAGTSRIRSIRVKVGSRSYGRWIRTRSGYSIVLPKVTGSILVRVQLRDASGRTSAVSSRRIRCTCS